MPFNGNVEVYQNIKKSEETSLEDEIGRIDNVVILKPPSEQENEFLNTIFQALNPLGVTEAKLTLAHDTVVEALAPPVLRTRIVLRSAILTVAGTSKVLTPSPGDDILGVNVPSLTDFLNAGKFDTTYVDDNLRISRGINILDELRVFVRAED